MLNILVPHLKRKDILSNAISEAIAWVPNRLAFRRLNKEFAPVIYLQPVFRPAGISANAISSYFAIFTLSRLRYQQRLGPDTHFNELLFTLRNHSNRISALKSCAVYELSR
jgi:hypothetical protein